MFVYKSFAYLYLSAYLYLLEYFEMVLKKAI